MKLQQLCRTVLSAQTGTCSEMPPPRRTTSVLRNTSTLTSYISKNADGVVITKTIKSFKEEYNTVRARLKAGIKEAKWRIRRDWRETSTPTTSKTRGRRSRPSRAHLATWPHTWWGHSWFCSLTTFMLALICSTKSQLSSLLCLQMTGCCQYPQRCEKNPAESEYE